MSRHTFRILDNGREVENINAGEYPSMAEAFCAGVNVLDDLCPRMSTNRHFYSVETIQIEDNKIDHNLIAAAPDLLAACKAALGLIDDLSSGNSVTTRSIDAIRDAIAKAEGATK